MWREIVDVLGDRAAKPFAVLDRKGRVQYFNARLEALLDRRWREALGTPAAKLFSAPAHQPETARQLALGLRGESQTADVVASNGAVPVRLRLEFSRVGSGASEHLVAVVARATPQGLAQLRTADAELDYEISSSASSFGLLRMVLVNSEKLPLAEDESRCFKLLHERAAPCPDCPVLLANAQTWPRTAIRLSPSREDGAGASVTLIAATLSGVDHVRLTRRTLRSDVMALVHASKIEALITRAQLSDREALVFRQMLEAQSLSEIGSRMRISVRTVKHHQTSLLRKLGARSKADLIRVVACDKVSL